MPPPGPRLVVCLALILSAPLQPGAGQTPVDSGIDTVVLQRLLVAEDARGTGREGLSPLMSALRSPDTLLHRLAIRGLGRLQRPELGRLLLASLGDSLPSVRAEAANAVAQSLRRVKRGATASDSSQLTPLEAATALTRALSTEIDAFAADMVARSLGRLPLPDSSAARAAEMAIRSRLATQATPGLVHGLYTLARARRLTGNLDPTSVALLRTTGVGAPDTGVRRLALATLAIAGGLDSGTAMHAARDPDPEVRRLTLRGSGTLPVGLRSRLVRQAMTDPSMIVRVEAIAAARLGDSPPDCSPILAATRDREPYVVLTAIDSLGSGCAGRGAAIAALRRLAAAPGTGGPPDHRWQVGAHAALALARLDSTAATRRLPAMVESKRVEVRQYAARVAAMAGARRVLLRLAADEDRNVQEAALAGLASTAGHEADSVYLHALGSSGNQVLLAAVEGLKGTTHPGAVTALVAAFQSLSARRSEDARDPRMAMLERLGELGSPADAPRLEPYLADFDTTVATTVATLLTKWKGDPVEAHPAPLPIRAEPLAEVFLRRSARLRVTMAPSSGGGTFTVRLFPDETPATVARVLRLAREGFYNGKVFQRVEPNFVIQGGGPDANEYVGDSAFMRDELTMRTHARGTLGISARGRDTGDGQWFINLVDNPLLDHEYTIFGRIDGGQAVAEHILEGDRIARIEEVDTP
jgi:cyclophilin family peptidyl-prolyl cis-trans isomerase/HEAT repeat protein